MNKNIHTIDRIVRFVGGAALVSLVFVGPQTPWGWIGLVFIGTAIMNFCPIYRILGISTCKISK